MKFSRLELYSVAVVLSHSIRVLRRTLPCMYLAFDDLDAWPGRRAKQIDQIEHGAGQESYLDAADHAHEERDNGCDRVPLCNRTLQRDQFSVEPRPFLRIRSGTLTLTAPLPQQLHDLQVDDEDHCCYQHRGERGPWNVIEVRR